MSLSTMTTRARAPATPAFRITAGAGVLWNTFGVFQFVQAETATRGSLTAVGMSAAQAELMSSYPVWMSAGFAIGTLGGLAGSVLLLQRKAATPVLLASLAGYLVLFVGDITEGVFAALGAGQIAILSTVVAIAVGLLWLSRRADRHGVLT